MSSTLNMGGSATTAAQQVLIVEDEFLIRLTLSEVLADEGYQVLEAGSGDEAIAIVESTPGIALLLTDIQLPGALDGRALVQRARQGRPDLPVIFMTGRPDALDEAGARDMFVAKPYLPSEICAAVRKMLAATG